MTTPLHTAINVGDKVTFDNDKIEIFKAVMNDYNIASYENLQFINEFPRITIPLKYKNPFYHYEDIINHLVEVTGEQWVER